MAAGAHEVPSGGSSLLPTPEGFAKHRANSPVLSAASTTRSYGSYQPQHGFSVGLVEQTKRRSSHPSALPESGNVHKKDERRKLRAANREPSGIWPAMHIVRPIFKHDTDWARFHEQYVEGTAGTGEVPSLAKWCVEYVTQAELDSMLDKKYREIARTKDQGRANRTASGIVGSIQKFVNKQLRDVYDAEVLQLGEDRALRFEGRLPELGVLSVDSALISTPPDVQSLWERGSFEVTHTEGYGPHAMSLLFDREPRRTFRKERDAIVNYIGSSAGLDLDTSCIDKRWEPRVTILNTYLTVGEIYNLDEPSIPLTMDLRAPQVCYVNPKMV